MNCTATTRLTAEECLARLDACPALPRGERLARLVTMHRSQYWPDRLWVTLIQRNENVPSCVYFDATRQLYIWTTGDAIQRWAAPVRRLREERRALREALADVIGPPCEKFGRYCLTHQNKDCRVDDARKLLGWEP